MSKKITLGFISIMLLVGLFGFGVIQHASAQGISFSLAQLVELLIRLEVIAPDKIEVARAFVASQNTTPANTTTQTTTATRRPLACGSKGDLDGNGIITRADYNLLAEVVVGNRSSTLAIADINGSGNIDAADYVALDRYIKGLDTTFTGCSATTVVVPITPTTNIPITATCTGTGSQLSAIWRASASGGMAPYSYNWDIYNSPTSHYSTNTSSSEYASTYSSSGSKQSLLRVSDALGRSVSVSCSANVLAASTATQQTTATTQLTPAITYSSVSSIVAGEVVTVYGNNFPMNADIVMDGRTTINTNSNSSNAVAFAVPSNTSAGVHTIQVGRASSNTIYDQNAGSLSNVVYLTVTTPINLAPTRQTCGGIEPVSNGYVQKGFSYYSSGYSPSTWTSITTGAPNACQYTCVNGGTDNGNGCSAPVVTLTNDISYDYIPASVVAGQVINIRVTNRGTKTWGSSHDVALSNSNLTSNLQMVNLGTTPPNTPVNVVFTAPTTAGTYVIRAVEQNFGWFGNNQTITVTAAQAVAQPISAYLNISSSCLVPGTNVTATAVVSGDGITSKILEKDTNSDTVYGQVANWGSGPGIHSFTTSESSTYSGRLDLKLSVNGIVRDSKSIMVSSQCAASVPAIEEEPAPEEQSNSAANSNFGNVLIGYDSIMKLLQILR
ncbi:MAG: dockerin type I repeat-containing protein [Patescibacteria group bacterium]